MQYITEIWNELQELKYSNILLNSQYEIVRYSGYASAFNDKSTFGYYCILAEREIDINQEGIKKRFLNTTVSMNSFAKEIRWQVIDRKGHGRDVLVNDQAIGYQQVDSWYHLNSGIDYVGCIFWWVVRAGVIIHQIGLATYLFFEDSKKTTTYVSN